MVRKKIFVIVITLILFLVPFFWFKPGEMDLGGDSSRLYFYDPIAYLKSYTLYGVSPSNFGQENIAYYGLPFILFLAFLKYIFTSSTLVIAFSHGFGLAIAFISIYLISLDLFPKKESFKSIREGSAIVAGLFYVFSPIL